ncbi:tRNA 5-carboxymethoxyuridine methyltransferase [Leminorella grimontii]|uniref:tRNA 5-carboxymethoxyuridine methyltransferase n=1 Tax=Leminorella grimontii TaxID=82981 RepID=A0AAV5N1Z2_9GAMM|nr:tRNA uridine 5-oxyacetic acid(34) methyltransferase CmoM [Leminorella grimontii]KFC96619.1 putative chromosome partitioning mechanism S-adenosylmethionine-dependent methyltransferase [Leminorella grimontii ATCC 33999 = DSM 5078]GKX56126.1 tRNA 5-carboxymethoxyuridine methyltransferase [Leminorella grimontii]GKX59184.1 tRNA 5-carboxymethoxyuridine methyltransferase [Leminorella grimontii]VFS57941.1 putative S-adenosyl-L-methionine-dependent methyltransferase [Leminorella grimontii]
MKDRNFDDIAEKLSRNIYGTTKGEIRQAVLWRDLDELMASMPDRPLRVLDAGGGEGIMACEMARRGHDVIFCDISETMLERARLSAVEKGVGDKIKFIHCAAQDAADRLDAPVDLVLFHAVLEWIDDQRGALLSVTKCLRPAGVLSLMFYNYDALLFRNVTLGNFGYIASGMRKRKRKSLSPDKPLAPQQVDEWLEDMGMSIVEKSGVRIFHDYMQDKQQQQQEFAALLALELRYCRQEPFVSLGRYIHVMARKPNESNVRDRRL